MKNRIVKYVMLALMFGMIGTVAEAQAKKKAAPSRTVKKRTTAKRTTNSKTKANINPAATADTAVVVAPKVDSLPIQVVKKSLRPNDAIERNLVKDRTPLTYEHIREDDAVYREKVWREIDTREKMNLPFVYAATEDNGSQHFISILLNAI